MNPLRLLKRPHLVLTVASILSAAPAIASGHPEGVDTQPVEMSPAASASRVEQAEPAQRVNPLHPASAPASAAEGRKALHELRMARCQRRPQTCVQAPSDPTASGDSDARPGSRSRSGGHKEIPKR